MSYWTEDRLKTLKAMAEEGYSASQIAARFGTSRSAIVGKIFRGKGKYGRLHATSGHVPKARVDQPKPRTVRISKQSARTGLLILKSEMQLAPPKAAPKRLPPRIFVPATPPPDPIPFLQAAEERRCLFYACDPMAPSGPDMLVCGDKVIDRFAAPGKRQRTHCARHFNISRNPDQRGARKAEEILEKEAV